MISLVVFQVTFQDSRFAKNEIVGRPPAQDHLMKVLSILLNKEQTHLWQFTRLYDELDRLSDSDQRERISPFSTKFSHKEAPSTTLFG